MSEREIIFTARIVGMFVLFLAGARLRERQWFSGLALLAVGIVMFFIGIR